MYQYEMGLSASWHGKEHGCTVVIESVRLALLMRLNELIEYCLVYWPFV